MLYVGPGVGVPGVKEIPSPCSLGVHPGDNDTNSIDNVNEVLCELSERVVKSAW